MEEEDQTILIHNIDDEYNVMEDVSISANID